jgi:hypothetical protein
MGKLNIKVFFIFCFHQFCFNILFAHANTFGFQSLLITLPYEERERTRAFK